MQKDAAPTWPPVDRVTRDRQSRCLLCLHPVVARSSAAVCAALEDHWRGTHPQQWRQADEKQRAVLGVIWGA